MLGYYNYTVILTYIGMLSSFGGMLCAIDGNITSALLCLLVSGFCDMIDGRVAATMVRTRPEKDFGIQIDSLCDLICFGAFPALLVRCLAPGSIVASCIGGLYLLCALIRLAYFNVEEAQRQSESDAPRKTYRGLPVTSSSLLLPLVIALARLAGIDPAVPTAVLLAVMGIAFLTPFRLGKPSMRGKVIMALAGLCELFIVMKGFIG